MSTDVSEEHIAYIFRVEEYAKQETRARALLATGFYAGFLLGLCFDPEDGSDMFLRNFKYLRTGRRNRNVGENLLQNKVIHHKPHMNRPGIETWPPWCLIHAPAGGRSMN
jgi:hypothetical protein